MCFHTNGVPLSYGPFGPILRVGPYAATSARSFVSWHLEKAYPGRTPNLRLFTGRENWDLCGMARSPHRRAGPVRHHHGRRRFRISRVGCIVAASTCEHAARTRTEQHGRMRPWASALCRTGRRHVMHGLEPVHATTHEAVRISRVGYIVAGSTREHAANARAKQRGRGRWQCDIHCASWAVGSCGAVCDATQRRRRHRSHRSRRRHRRG